MNNYTENIFLGSWDTHILDSEYRYKMKPLNVKCYGKQDNWTTYILNSNEVSKIIKRPSSYIGKYIGYALSCPMKQDKEYDCLSFKGKYTQEQITNHFMDFVKIYVLCPSCDLPETQLFMQKEKNKPKGLTHTCEACGTLSLVKAKLTDKTFEFIEKNIK